MYGQYGHGTISAPIATSASITAAIPILGFNKIVLELPGTTNLVSTAPDIYVYLCQTSTGGTFRKLMTVNESINTAATAVDWVIKGTTGNRYVPIPGAVGHAFMQIEASVSATAAAGWELIVHGIM